MEEFNRTASVVATNIQKLVQNVSSMQRMLVHVETQVWGSCVFFFQLKWYPVEKGEGLRSQLRQLQHYTGQLAKDTAGQLKQLADAQVESILSLNFKTKCRSCKIFLPLVVFPMSENCLRWLTVEHVFKGRGCKMNSQRWNQYLILILLLLLWISRTWFAGSE